MLIEIKELKSGEHIAYLKDDIGNNLIAEISNTLSEIIEAAKKIKEKYCKKEKLNIIIKVD